MSDTLTIAAVKFLNARPLIYGLEREPDVRLRLGLPGEMASLLKSGEVDAALIPSIEYARLAADVGERARFRRAEGDGRTVGPRQFVILPVGAVGSRGRVGSVRLFGYVEEARLKRVLLDPFSRTSNALAQILVVRRMGVRPHFVVPEELGAAGVKAAFSGRRPDAELVVGDRGLAAERPEAEWELDLGLEWHRFTHLPLVYAFWVARADGPVERLTTLLHSARERGLRAIEALADAAPEAHGVPADRARRYLEDEIRYDFGSKERTGLEAFFRMAAEEGLAPDGVHLRMAS